MNDEEKEIYRANLDFNHSLYTLAHFGIPGMKWGVRNEETLRKYNGGNGRRRAGDTTRVKRREKFMNRVGSRSKKNKLSKPNSHQDLHSDVKNLSDADLIRMSNRLQNEILYKQRMAQMQELNKTTPQRWKDNLAKEAGDAARDVARKQVRKWGNKAADAGMKYLVDSVKDIPISEILKKSK